MNAVQPARASTLVPNSHAIDHSTEVPDDIALPSATGTPMEIHSAGMPHLLVLVGAYRYQVPGSKRKHSLRLAAEAAVQSYSITVEQH